MSAGLLIVTHNRIGEELLATARSILGVCPLRTAHVAVHQGEDPGSAARAGEEALWRLDDGDGVLILTDAFGSTPSNVAVRLAESAYATVVAGVNLPMLLRVLNYPDLTLAELQRKAVSGGRDGVLLVEPPRAVRHEQRS